MDTQVSLKMESYHETDNWTGIHFESISVDGRRLHITYGKGMLSDIMGRIQRWCEDAVLTKAGDKLILERVGPGYSNCIEHENVVQLSLF